MLKVLVHAENFNRFIHFKIQGASWLKPRIYRSKVLAAANGQGKVSSAADQTLFILHKPSKVFNHPSWYCITLLKYFWSNFTKRISLLASGEGVKKSYQLNVVSERTQTSCNQGSWEVAQKQRFHGHQSKMVVCFEIQYYFGTDKQDQMA